MSYDKRLFMFLETNNYYIINEFNAIPEKYSELLFRSLIFKINDLNNILNC